MFISFAWQVPCRQASLQKLRKCVLGEGLTGYIPETSEGCAQLNRLSHWAISSLNSGRVFFGWDMHFCPSPDLQAQSKNTWVTFLLLQSPVTCGRFIAPAEKRVPKWPWHIGKFHSTERVQIFQEMVRAGPGLWREHSQLQCQLLYFLFFFLSPFSRKLRNQFSEFLMSTWWWYGKEYREFLVFAISGKLFASWMINICHMTESFSRLAFNLLSKCCPLLVSPLSPAPCGCLNDKYGVWKFTC